MAEPWDELDARSTAVCTTALLSELHARVQLVAAVRSDAVRTMRADGMSVRAICDALGLSRWVVCALLSGQRSDGDTPPNTP